MVIRSVVLYLVFVGLPLMGMSVVLQVGRRLHAPVSFGGSWQVEARPRSSCAQLTDQLLIEQSGPALQITTRAGEHLAGQVNASGFTAQGAGDLRIEAHRRPGREAEWEGTADGIPCDSARGVPIRAIRLRLPRDLTGH